MRSQEPRVDPRLPSNPHEREESTRKICFRSPLWLITTGMWLICTWCVCSVAPLRAAETLSVRVTSVCGRMSVVSLTSDLKQLLRSVMYSVPGYGICPANTVPGQILNTDSHYAREAPPNSCTPADRVYVLCTAGSAAVPAMHACWSKTMACALAGVRSLVIVAAVASWSCGNSDEHA